MSRLCKWHRTCSERSAVEIKEVSPLKHFHAALHCQNLFRLDLYTNYFYNKKSFWTPGPGKWWKGVITLRLFFFTAFSPTCILLQGLHLRIQGGPSLLKKCCFFPFDLIVAILHRNYIYTDVCCFIKIPVIKKYDILLVMNIAIFTHSWDSERSERHSRLEH